MQAKSDAKTPNASTLVDEQTLAAVYQQLRAAAKRARADEVLLVESRMVDMACKNSEDWLALDQALNELNTLDARAVEVVTLRFFAGLTIEKTAEVLGISSRSAARDWRRARAFLIERLGV